MTEVVYVLISVDFDKCEDDTFTHVISVFKNEDRAYKALKESVRIDISNGDEPLSDVSLEAAGDDHKKLERICLRCDSHRILRHYEVRKTKMEVEA